MVQFKNIKDVLVADDSADFRFLISVNLSDSGLVCHEAENGQVAIEILKKQSIDLIITDFRMPIIDGVQLLAWCRSNHLHMPVIFMSSDIHLVAPEQVALADCCATLLPKPFDSRIFLEAVVAADARSHHLNCIHRA